ncbi:MAG: hypothetical protein HY608_10245 [Planctomycetes bacterium]|nr:hypothetical protein [Planctomycetota bacterium]
MRRRMGAWRVALACFGLFFQVAWCEDPPPVGTPVPASPTPQQQVDSLFDRARALPDAQRVPLYEQAVRLAPDRAEAWCNLAAARIRSGSARRAREAAAKALALAPSLYEARLNASALACIEASSDGAVGNKSLPKLDPVARDLASLRSSFPDRPGAARTLLWIAFQRGDRDGMIAAASLVEGEAARWAALAEAVDRALVDLTPVLAQPPGSHVDEDAAGGDLRAFLAASWPEDPGLMERALAPQVGGRGGGEVAPAGLALLRLAVLHRRSASPTLVYERGQRDALAGILPDLREKAVLEAALRATLRPVAAYVGEVEAP